MIIKDNNLRVMEIFFKYPEKKFYLRELARLTKLSAPGLMKIIKRLKEAELIKTETTKTTKNIFASKTEKFVLTKRLYNIHSLYNSGIIEYLRSKYEEPEAIILFGSYSKGEDNSSSDIDIAIIAGKHIEISLTEFEKKLARKISIQEIKITDAEKEFLNSLANGIVLYGYLKVFK